MAEPMGNACDELLRKVDKLEETNGALCAEINRQERVIERLNAEYAELAQINHHYAERIRELESLLVDVWPYVWALRIPGRRDEEFEARFEELGLEAVE